MRIGVDPTNPGQFFACCGLLEIAGRLANGSQAWFEEAGTQFSLSTADSAATLRDVLTAAHDVRLSGESADDEDDDDEDDAAGDEEEDASPFVIVAPFQMRLDWWKDKSLKTWAGSMNARRIFVAMCNAIAPDNADPLNQGHVVYDPGEAKKPKKREPFYFDARRGANAKSIDVGFAPDALKKLTSIAFPVVEALCMIGLQRCRPRPTDTPRVFDYYTWLTPLDACVIPAAVSGFLGSNEARRFRFANAFRTDQRKHKGFRMATPVARS